MAVKQELVSKIGELDKEAATFLKQEHYDDALLMVEAAEELNVLGRLTSAINIEREAKLKQNINNAVVNSKAFPPNYDISSHLDVLDELNRQGYSKVLTLEVESGALVKYRVTQANKSIIQDVNKKAINVVNRLAPLASFLVTADLGDEIEFKGKSIGFVVAINYVKKNQFVGNDFESVELNYDGFNSGEESKKLTHAKTSLINWLSNLKKTSIGESAAPVYEVGFDSDAKAALGCEFYTRTTVEQEELIQYPNRGVMLIEGIAGSGKTSVALGRVKKLKDSSYFSPEDDGYDDFFKDAHRMVGFVLHKQLVPYLKETCSSGGLNLPGMPVKEYKELHNDLIRRNQSLLQLKIPGNENGKFTRTTKSFHFEEQTREQWLRVVQSLVLKSLIGEITTSLDKNSERFLNYKLPEKLITKRGHDYALLIRVAWQSFIVSVSKRLKARLDHHDKWGYEIKGIAKDLVAIYQEWHGLFLPTKPWYISDTGIHLKRKSDDDKQFFPFKTEHLDSVASETLSKLKHQLRESVKGYFRINPHGTQFRLTDWYLEALNDSRLIKQYGSSNILLVQDSLRNNRLTEADLDLLTILCSLVTHGHKDDEIAYHLNEPAYYTSVFIDEVQDFSELQVMNMALQADPKRYAITAVGDFKQQLYSNTVNNLEFCFPMASSSQKAIHSLTVNKRQKPVLAKFSQYVREYLEGSNFTVPEPNYSSSELQRISVEPMEVADKVFDLLSCIGPNKSIAVICPQSSQAKALEEELSEHIATLFRESHYAANSNELNKPYYVHFTTPKPTKGLEFDVVVIPYFNEFKWEDSIDGNHLYVSVSRSKEKLLLINVE